jgi:hypothetical protein
MIFIHFTHVQLFTNSNISINNNKLTYNEFQRKINKWQESSGKV